LRSCAGRRPADRGGKLWLASRDRLKSTWTEHYPDLGTGLVSFEDPISPAFCKLEREAIFKRAWLCVGRVEELRRNGSYFTKQLPPRHAAINGRGLVDATGGWLGRAKAKYAHGAPFPD